MDAWDHIRRAVSDRRSGSVDIALRAARGLSGLRTRAETQKAARALVRAHPAMGALRRMCATALDGGDVDGFARALEAQAAAAADAVRWIVTKRGSVVLTHSASGSVVEALERVRARIALVLCTVSLPGAEGRVLARRLERDGFEVEVIGDAAIAEGAARADVALVGADAVTGDEVVNKVGTRLVALAARDAGIGCYAIACSGKFVPRAREHADYDRTPLELFDAVVTERGPQRPAQIRRAVARVHIPRALEAIG